MSKVYRTGGRSREPDESPRLALGVPLKWRLLRRDLRDSFATQLILGLGAFKLRLGVAHIAVISKHIASRGRSQYVHLPIFQVPRMIPSPDSMPAVVLLHPMPKVVRPSRSDSSIHLHQHHERCCGGAHGGHAAEPAITTRCPSMAFRTTNIAGIVHHFSCAAQVNW